MRDLGTKYRRRAAIREGAKTLAIAALPIIAVLIIILLTVHTYQLIRGDS